MTAFTNAEEDAVKRRDVVPFTCEDALTKIGGKFVDGGVFKPQGLLSLWLRTEMLPNRACRRETMEHEPTEGPPNHPPPANTPPRVS